MEAIEADKLFKELQRDFYDFLEMEGITPVAIDLSAPLSEYEEVYGKLLPETDVEDFRGYVLAIKKRVDEILLVKENAIEPINPAVGGKGEDQSSSSSSSSSTPVRYVSDITPFDVLYLNWHGHDEARKNLKAMMEMKFSKTELNSLVEELRKLDISTWKPIQEVTYEEVKLSRSNVDEIIVHSVEFMSEFYKKIPASRKYTPNGVEYTAGGGVATVYRGVPTDQKSADLLSKWTSTAGKSYVFPVTPASNQRLGLLLSGVKQSSTKITGVQFHSFTPDDSHWLPPSTKAEFVSLLNSISDNIKENASHIKLIHEIQNTIARDIKLQEKLDKLIAISNKKWEQYHVDAEGVKVMYASDVPVTMGEAATAISQLNVNKNLRNHGLGGAVWHRMVNNMPGANYDVHDAQLINAMPNLDGKMAILGATDEFTGMIKSQGKALSYESVSFVGPGKVDIRGADGLFVVTMAKGKAGGAGATDTNIIRGSLRLEIGEEIKAGFKMYIRLNALSLSKEIFSNREYMNSFIGWKFLGAFKSGGVHTPDGVYVFERVDGVAAADGNQARFAFETKIRHFVGYALAADKYMTMMKSCGALGLKPRFEHMVVTAGKHVVNLNQSKSILFAKEISLGRCIEHVAVEALGGEDYGAAMEKVEQMEEEL